MSPVEGKGAFVSFPRCHLLEEDIRLCMCLPRYRIMRVGRFRHLVPVVSPDGVDVAVVVE